MAGDEMIDDFVLTADDPFVDFFTITTQLTGAGWLEHDGQPVDPPYEVQVGAGDPVEIDYIAEDYRVIDELAFRGGAGYGSLSMGLAGANSCAGPHTVGGRVRCGVHREQLQRKGEWNE